MKVLFLDIDGVLNCKDTVNRYDGFIGIDPYLVAIFNRIIFATDAKIVLSSTWRLAKFSRDEVRRRVMDFIDVTPRLSKPGDMSSTGRGLEINAWLKEHPEVKKYAILDDDSDFLPDQPLFQTTWEKGLTDEIANKVIKHLNSK